MTLALKSSLNSKSKKYYNPTLNTTYRITLFDGGTKSLEGIEESEWA